MDFAKLMSLASKNQKKVEKSTTAPKRYDTSIPPPTRDPKKKATGVQSAGVRAFLEKKEKEEKAKELAEKRKSEKCTQRYMESKKDVKKSPAQKETKPKGFSIPKVSQSDKKSEEKASPRITTKLVHPSARNSDDSKKDSHLSSKDITSAKYGIGTSSGKDRPGVFTSLKKKDKVKGVEKPVQGRRERAPPTKISGRAGTPSEDKPSASKVVKKVIRKPMHSGAKAPMSFSDILKLAQNKDRSVENGANKRDSNMPDRPMTKEEKEHLARKQTKEYQERFYGNGSSSPSSSKGKITPVDSQNDKSKLISKNTSTKPSLKGVQQKNNGANIAQKHSDVPKLNRTSKSIQGRVVAETMQKKKEARYAETRENVLVCHPAPAEKEEAISTWDRLYKRMNKNRPVKRQHEEEEIDDYSDGYDEDEYDDDMDDFIDDGPAGGAEEAESSKYIREIFGYDKRKYRFERDEDLASMETNFASQMKEEARSARLGRLEDIEDMKQEEMERKRKMGAKKMKKCR